MNKPKHTISSLKRILNRESDRNEKFKLTLFFIYTIIYEVLIWGMVVGAIYYLKWSEWTVLVGVIMSGSQLMPKHFGLKYKEKDKLCQIN